MTVVRYTGNSRTKQPSFFALGMLGAWANIERWQPPLLPYSLPYTKGSKRICAKMSRKDGPTLHADFDDKIKCPSRPEN